MYRIRTMLALLALVAGLGMGAGAVKAQETKAAPDTGALAVYHGDNGLTPTFPVVNPKASVKAKYDDMTGETVVKTNLFVSGKGGFLKSMVSGNSSDVSIDVAFSYNGRVMTEAPKTASIVLGLTISPSLLNTVTASESDNRANAIVNGNAQTQGSDFVLYLMADGEQPYRCQIPLQKTDDHHIGSGVTTVKLRGTVDVATLVKLINTQEIKGRVKGAEDFAISGGQLERLGQLVARMNPALIGK